MNTDGFGNVENFFSQVHNIGNSDFCPGSPDSRLSEISFPSHVSGLESFADLEETVQDVSVVANGDPIDTHALDNQVDNNKSDAVLKESRSGDLLNDFLKMSSPPMSTSVSNQNSLDESSMSLSKLEALQANLHDSFLKSHSDDSEREKQLRDFLEQPTCTSENKKKTLSSMIDQTHNGDDNLRITGARTETSHAADTPNHLPLNQTELDSLFLKDVRHRLQLSNLETTVGSPFSSDDINDTLRQIDEVTQLKDSNKGFTVELEEKLKKKINESMVDRYDRGGIEQIQRPNLDGSSSGSEDDGVAATNFARTNVQTLTLNRFNLQQELEELNLENIPERQLAEGGDDSNEVFNDGGGGGDGSSGHSDTDVGGADGGVSIITNRLQPVVGTERENLDDERVTPPSRERPVGGSGPSNDVVTSTRQVQFSTPPVVVTSHGNSASNVADSSDSNSNDGQNNDEGQNQDSRLSARYFLAASTPFKTSDQTEDDNWLSQSSFHISQTKEQQQNDERTLVGEDFTMVTPSTATLSKLRHEYGEPPNWTFGSPTANNMTKLRTTNQLISNGEKTLINDSQEVNNTGESETGSAHTLVAHPEKVYNPFDSFTDSATVDFGLDASAGWKIESFDTSQHDLENLLVEDEKVIALNNNSVYKVGDETTLSEWSLHSDNQRINSALLPSGSNIDDGRVSVYFKAKSHELGHLSGDEGPRPNFSDDSHEVITPPTAAPVPLVKEVTSIDKDQTIPLGAWSNKTFNVELDVNEQMVNDSDQSETPKSRLLSTHKRNSDTVLQKKKKRQLIGKEDKAKKSLNQDGDKSIQSVRRKSSSRENSSKHTDADADASINALKHHTSIVAPISEVEADTLLDDIKGRRVSTAGMTKAQIVELAKCISSMTGTNIELVYKLILLLPRNQGNSLQTVNHVSPQQSLKQTKTMENIPIPYNSVNDANFVQNMKYVKSPAQTSTERLYYSEPLGKPISSIIPLNSYDKNQGNTNVNPQHHQNNHYLHSTQMPDRYSDPSPLTQNRVKADPRLAISVNPVRHHYAQQEYSAGFYNSNLITKERFEHVQNFHPLQSQRSSQEGSTLHNFHPLHHHTRRTASNPESGSYSGMCPSDDYGVLVSNKKYNSRYQHSVNTSQPDTYPTYSADGISFPKEVAFDVCCVETTLSKVIQFHNSNNCWMQCQLHVVFFAHNGQETDYEHIFSFPPKITMDPHSSEDVKIKFSPTQTGTYMMKIELMVAGLIAEEANLKWQRVANILNIEGIAETPDLEILLDQNKCLDFGEMPYGSKRTQELKILNKGRADVPIYVNIAESSADSQYFKLEIHKKDQREVGDSVYLSSTLSVLVPGRKHAGLAMKPKIITLKFDSPSRKDQDIHKQVISSPPEDFSCYVSIHTDTKRSIPISSVLMKAKVGVLRLHSLRTMQAISLSTLEGQHISRVIPLKNAGNISLQLESKIMGGSPYFSIMPSLVNIKPGMQSELKVAFKSATAISVESRLVVCVLPDGDQYEWNLKGQATEKIAIEKDDRPILLCNKLALNWPGVPIGQSKQQRLILRNNSEVDYVHLSMNIAGDHSNFQIQNDSLLQQRAINKFEAVLKPEGELPVHVLFAPSCFAMMNSSLVLRTVNGTTKFVIPLSGYGGASNLDINGAKKLNDQFWIDIGEVYLGKRNVVNVMLRNSGSRAAFVSLKCFSDITARLEYPDTHVTITPNNFVLTEKASEQVNIFYQPLKNHALKSQEGTFTCAHLVIYSGDEVMRSQYRKNFTGVKSHGVNVSQILQLTSDFKHQSNISEEISYTTVPDWEQFFFANISKTVIAMVATSERHYEADKPAAKDQLQKEIAHVTPAQKLQPVTAFPGKNTLKSELWSVYPEQIILSSSEESPASKIQLINYSDVTVSFEFIWPAQTLVITPCKDTIPAKSQLAIRINAKPSFLARQEDLPWRGSIYVQCGGEQKCVNVQIRSDVICDQSPGLPLSTQQLMPLDTHNMSLLTYSTPLADHSVTIAPHILEFQNTKVNMVAESSFIITNKTPQSCRWFLSSIAPPYFKEQNSKGDIVRATYTAFRFAKHSGKLNGKQIFKLPVSFLPRDGGVYSQFWDFEVSYEHLQAPVKARIELIGQGSCTDAKYSSPNTSRKQVGTARPILMDPKRNNERYESYEPPDKKMDAKKGHVFIKDDCLKFPATKVGERSELKFRLCNDSSEVQKVRISGFRSPFSVIQKHVRLSIRPKSYVRVPVYYSPTAKLVEVSEGLLIISPESGETLCVKLVGESESS